MNSQFQIWNAGGLPSELLFLFHSAYGKYEKLGGAGAIYAIFKFVLALSCNLKFFNVYCYFGLFD